MVALTIDSEVPDAAIEFVRAELAAKLPSADQPWQSEQPHLLPRWQVTS